MKAPTGEQAMSMSEVRDVLMWSAIINYSVLLWWFFFITMAHDWTYRMHSRFFQLTEQQFDVTHYAGIGLFKILVFIFNIVPWLAILIIE
ncbi:MAG: hypothetical protein OQL16_00265 [Gammaproteobacteria bacterium]|nr:hypothetical protein [Gammaproteobacteria bacterium]